MFATLCITNISNICRLPILIFVMWQFYCSVAHWFDEPLLFFELVHQLHKYTEKKILIRRKFFTKATDTYFTEYIYAFFMTLPSEWIIYMTLPSEWIVYTFFTCLIQELKRSTIFCSIQSNPIFSQSPFFSIRTTLIVLKNRVYQNLGGYTACFLIV